MMCFLRLTNIQHSENYFTQDDFTLLIYNQNYQNIKRTLRKILSVS